PPRRAVQVGRHAREGVRRRAEQGEALVRGGKALQPPRHAVAVEDLSVTRPGGLRKTDCARRRDVQKARKRARQGDDEERTELLRMRPFSAASEQSEPVHASRLRMSAARFIRDRCEWNGRNARAHRPQIPDTQERNLIMLLNGSGALYVRLTPAWGVVDMSS